MASSTTQFNFGPTSGAAPKSLQDIFGELGDINTKLYDTQRAPIKAQKLSELAATNRLSSGIAEHSLNALDQNTALGEAQIRGATIPQIGQGILQDDSQQFQDEEAQKEFDRSMALAKTVGGMNKPSTLSQIFQGVGSVGSLVGGLYTGNPALVAGGVKGIASMADSGGGTQYDNPDLYSIFHNSNTPESPLSLYDQNTIPGRRYF